MNTHHYSVNYAEARDRFREAATRTGAQLHAYPIQVDGYDNDAFTIDVAILGNADCPALVTSSAVHGVEGFIGSAVQLAMLEQSDPEWSNGVRQVFIHGVNPVGFASLRRFNEDNVDLNRNFLNAESRFSGASPHYKRLNRFLNPESPPTRFELFKFKAAWNIARFGLSALKQSIAQGQYDFPRGIFYGGSGPSQSNLVIRDHCDEWIGRARPVIHLDFHTGLGPFGDYKLLINEAEGSEACRWYRSVFDADAIETLSEDAPTGYQTSGPMGEWLQNHFDARDYHFVTAEFGTYDPLTVLAALRSENRAHHYAQPDSPQYARAKAELLECFTPGDAQWRSRVLASGLTIVQQARRALQGLRGQRSH